MKSFLLSLGILIPILYSCTNDYIEIDENKTPSANDKISLIYEYIRECKGEETRSVPELSPICIDGDTVLLYMNYKEGWEIFSYDTTLPMVLMSSDKGAFNDSILKMNGPFPEYLNSVIEGLSFNKGSINSNTNGDWNVRDTIPFPNPGNNTYYIYDTISTSHLTNTEWFQEYPWNSCVPKCNNTRSKLGCCAVALGIFIYYTDLSESINFPIIPFYAEEHNNSFSFSDFRDGCWDSLAYNMEEEDKYFNTARYLGYLAKQIDSDFGSSETKSSIQKCKNFLDTLQINNQSVFKVKLDNYNPDSVISRLQNGKIVMARAGRPESENMGHVFIIDGLVTITKRLPLSKNSSSVNNRNYYYLMRWGDFPQYDDVLCSSEIDAIWDRGNGSYYSAKKRVLYLQ